MKWLITGGCGFIGRNLIRTIKKNSPEARIRVLDDLSVCTLEDLHYTDQKVLEVRLTEDLSWTAEHIQFLRGNVVDPKLALSCSLGADIVVHLAANTGVGPSVENPRGDCITNVIGTFNYLEACRINRIKRFIFASSGAPIGDCNPPIHEELACHPISPYGASKLAGEGYCSAYHKSYGVETVALRFGNAYGPGSGHKNSIIAKFIRQAMNGEVLEIYGDGSQTRDFIFIEDIVSAIISASIRSGIGGEVFQVATNQETTILDLSQTLLHIFQEQGLYDVEVQHRPNRIGDAMRNYSDTSKVRRKLGWTTKFTLEGGLRITLDEYLQGKKVFEASQSHKFLKENIIY